MGEVEELRAEVERLRIRNKSLWADLGQANQWSWEQHDRAESAERARDAALAEVTELRDRLGRVEALADFLDESGVTWRCSTCGWAADETTIDGALWREANRHVSMVCPECGAEGSFVDHEPAVESVAARVHEAWMTTKAAQGVTSRPSEWGEEQMVPYADLSERAKDLDRATVRSVFDALRAAVPVTGDTEDASPAAEDTARWTCRRCGSHGWVGWAAGPDMPRKAQCVACGAVQSLAVTGAAGPTEQATEGGAK